MTLIPEGSLRCEFDDALWTAIKWDAHAAYTHGIGKLQGELTDPVSSQKRPAGTRAVDIVGVHAGALYLIEIKDFRGYEAANAYRQEDELPLEVGFKVRDTIAGLVGAHASGRNAALLGPFIRALADARPVRVIAWILEDKGGSAGERRKYIAMNDTRTKQLARRLGWLTSSAWVDDPLNPYLALPGVAVRQA
ncbi:MAG TPA: hypothetical protein VGB85_28060 [Nannocystis sp.]